MAGDETNGHPTGTKPGDVIHYFQSGTIQMPDVGRSTRPATSGWRTTGMSIEAASLPKSDPPHLDLGRRSGITVIYVVAAPVKTPLMGPVRPN